MFLKKGEKDMKRTLSFFVYMIGFVTAITAPLVSSPDGGSKVIAIESEGAFTQAINGDTLSIVEFYAPWCGFCKRISPVYDALSKEFPKIKFCKLDCTSTYGKTLAEKYGIEGFPTFKFFKSGKEVDVVVGADEKGLRDKISSHS